MLPCEISSAIENQRQDRLADPGAPAHVGPSDFHLFHEGTQHHAIAHVRHFDMLILILLDEVTQHIEVIGVGWRQIVAVGQFVNDTRCRVPRASVRMGRNGNRAISTR